MTHRTTQILQIWGSSVMIPTQYRIKLLLSVSDAWKHNSTIAMLSVMILPVNATLLAPSLSSIRFTDNGNGVYIVFTTATYCGGIESTLSYWSCDIVLTIASDEKARSSTTFPTCAPSSCYCLRE